MDTNTRKKIVDLSRAYMVEDYHCSEAILLAAANHYLPDLDPLVVRLSTPFAGGVGTTKTELCGALSGGLLLIGALYGRSDAHSNDDLCQQLAAGWRTRFLREFGYTRCQDLRDHWVGQPGQADCKDLVARATGLLVDFLEEAG
jgi:C_GCAxxG_C_C family probable redox protein